MFKKTLDNLLILGLGFLTSLLSAHHVFYYRVDELDSWISLHHIDYSIFTIGLIFGIAILLLSNNQLRKISYTRKILFLLTSTLAYFLAGIGGMVIGIQLDEISITSDIVALSPQGILFYIISAFIGTSILLIGIRFNLKYKITMTMTFIAMISSIILSLSFVVFDASSPTEKFNFFTYFLPYLLWQTIMLYIIKFIILSEPLNTPISVIPVKPKVEEARSEE